MSCKHTLTKAEHEKEVDDAKGKDKGMLREVRRGQFCPAAPSEDVVVPGVRYRDEQAAAWSGEDQGKGLEVMTQGNDARAVSVWDAAQKAFEDWLLLQNDDVNDLGLLDQIDLYADATMS